MPEERNWTYHENSEFPFKALTNADGDLFNTAAEAKEFWKCDWSNVWSVIEPEDNTYVYGPPRHFVNRMGYVVTKEAHDNNTYYEESFA